MVCRFSRKKSKKDCLILEAFMMQGILKPSREDARKTGVPQVGALNPGQSKHPAEREKKDHTLFPLLAPTREPAGQNRSTFEFRDARAPCVPARKCSYRRVFPPLIRTL